MDLSIVSHILQELVPFHFQISLPGLGCFVVDEKPSQIVNRGTTITPPQKSLRFSFTIGKNDGLIEKEYAKLMNENAHEARLSVERVMREIKEQLTQNRRVKLPQLGELKFNENGELLFIPASDISVFSATMQPSVVNIVPKGNIEYVTVEIPAAPEFDNILMQRILDYTLKASVIARSCKDATSGRAPIHATLYTPYRGTEATECREQPYTAKTEQETGLCESVVDKEERNEGKNVAHRIAETETGKPGISKKQLWIAIALIIVIIVILLITIVYIMQDELRPLLEKLLYNAKERALIHHFIV